MKRPTLNWFRLPVLGSLLIGALVLPNSAVHSQDFQYALEDASEGRRVDDFQLADHAAKEIASRWKVSQRILHGGSQEGVSLVTIDNGALTVEIIPTRGMNILRATVSESGERVFGWDSPVKQVVHPSLIDLESRGGLGWLEGFNEWMVRCGLEFAGHPGTDRFRTNTGGESEMDLTLHGRIGNIPASNVRIEIQSTPPYRLRLSGVVDEVMFNGPRLRLVSYLEMLPDKNQLVLRETIENIGATEQEYQIIYHTNFGTPLLEEGSRVVIPARTVEPMNDKAADGVESYDRYGPPTAGYVEEVFLIEPHVDTKGWTGAVLHDAKGKRGAMMRWQSDSLPYLTLWKNTAALKDGYVTGIEPGSGYPFNRRIERHFGRVPKLAAGTSVEFELEFHFLPDKASVSKAVQDIQSISGGETATVKVTPPVLPEFGR